MIDKQFFDTFGIKPKKGCTAYDKFTEEEADAICNDKCAECLYLDDVYPQITDRILLELICILSESPISISFDALMLGVSDVEKLKGYILLACMGFAKDIKHQVCTLFKEYNNDR